MATCPKLRLDTESLPDWERNFAVYMGKTFPGSADVTQYAFNGIKPYYLEVEDGEETELADKREKQKYFGNARFFVTELVNHLDAEISAKVKSSEKYEKYMAGARVKKIWNLIKSVYQCSDNEVTKLKRVLDLNRDFQNLMHSEELGILEFNRQYLQYREKLASFKVNMTVDGYDPEMVVICDYVRRLVGTTGVIVSQYYNAGGLPQTLHEVMQFAVSQSARKVEQETLINTARSRPRFEKRKPHPHEANGVEQDEKRRRPDKKKRKRVNVVAVNRVLPKSNAETMVQLDTGADIHVIGDTRILRDFANCTPKPIGGVGGSTEATRTATLPGFGKVYVGEDPTINVLSAKLLKPTHLLTYSQEDESFSCTDRVSGEKRVFSTMETDGCQLAYVTPFPHIGKVNVTKTHTAEKVRSWHAAMGHPSDSAMKEIIRNDTLRNIPFSVSDIDVCTEVLGPCVACAQGKSHKDKRNNISNPVSEQVGEHVSVDTMFLKSKAYFLAVDDVSKHITIRALGDRSQKSFKEAIDNLRLEYKQYGHDIKTIRTDRESAISSKEFVEYLAAEKTKVSFSVAEGHAVSAERAIRTLKERFRTSLAALPYVLPESLYGHLLMHIVTCLNLTPHAGTHGNAPFTKFAGVKPDFSLVPKAKFGDIVCSTETYVHQHPSDAMRGKVGLCLGIDLRTPKSILFKCLTEPDATILRRAHYTVLKAEIGLQYFPKNDEYVNFPKRGDISDDIEEQITSPDQRVQVEEEKNTSHDQKIQRGKTTNTSDQRVQVEEEKSTSHDQKMQKGKTPNMSDQRVQTYAEAVKSKRNEKKTIYSNKPTSGEASTRSGRSIKPPNMESYVRKMTIGQAIERYPTDAPTAITKELNQLLDYNVFEPAVNATVPAMPSSFFVSEKLNPDGTFNKLKARLVAGGHREKFDENAKSYSPVVNPVVSNILLSLAASKNYDIRVWDVRCAYLNADMDRDDLYMRLEPKTTKLLIKLKPEWSKHMTKGGTIVLRLLKALYGTKEAAMLWNSNISNTLINLKLKQSKADPCLFYSNINGKVVYIGLHVDDLLIVGNDTKRINELKEKLICTYKEISEQTGNELNYLGISLKRNNIDGSIFLSQPCMIQQLVEENCSSMKPVNNPCAFNLTEKTESELLCAEEKSKYRSIVMKLLYLSNKTRPDISFPVAYLATFSHCPTKKNYDDLLQIIAYLKATQSTGILFSKSDNIECIHVYADASYCLHSDAKSQTGLAVFLGDSSAPIYVKSKKQSILTESTTDAEITAIHSSIYVVNLIKDVYKELNLKADVIFYQDNKAAETIITTNSNIVKKDRAMKVRIEKLRETLKHLKAEVSHESTTEMIADILTKRLATKVFENLRKDILGYRVENNTKEKSSSRVFNNN